MLGSAARMAAILAAILDFQRTCMSSMIFNGFIGLGMVENHYLDAKIMTLSWLVRKLHLFFLYSPLFLLCSAAILAAILDFQVRCMLCIVFDGFIGSGMVENLYLDTNILTLSALLREIEPFSCIEFRPIMTWQPSWRPSWIFQNAQNLFLPPPPPTENDPWDHCLDESSEKIV